MVAGKYGVLSADIECFSDVDLIKCGVYAYADSPAFEILLFAYSFDGGETQIIDLAQGEKFPAEVEEAIFDVSVTKTAYNANFERTCLSKHFGRYIPPESWHCSAVQAAMLALPRSLEDVGRVLGLDEQKMKEGKELIRYFCVPCKSTKANGGRTRNLPCHAPEKWELFKTYCKRDVDVEKSIRRKLHNFPIPESEMELYRLDQRINDRGVLVDMGLVKQAIACERLHKEVVTKRAYELTGLENPNSVAQLKGWLGDMGMEAESLSKKAVSEMIAETDGEVEELLRLRLLMAKTSVKKYEAMERSVCSDGRVHGMLMFYGANRSGRWSGKIVQIQNLPQNHIPDLELARDLVKQGRFEDIELLYDSTPNVLSELIRTAFIPKPGCRFVVADFSAIEARVLAWLSGEQWRLDVFTSHGKIYEASASAMFHVPVEEITKASPLRQKGKVAELACIAEDSLVLTDKGLVPIQDVTKEHLLWDGEEWVKHDGVVCRGRKEIMEYEGLRATADHPVWVQGEQRPVQLGIAAARGAHLIQTGNGRDAVRMGGDHFTGEAVGANMEPLLCADQVQRLWKCAVAVFRKFNIRKIQRMQGMFKTPADTKVARKKIIGSKTKMRESQNRAVCPIWRKGNRIQVSFCFGGGIVDIRKCGKCASRFRTGSHQHKWALRAGECAFCGKCSKQCEQAHQRDTVLSSGRVAICKRCCDKEAIQRDEQGRDYCRCTEGGGRKEEELAADRGTARVYDIRNAGPRHRFTVSGRLVHNCGYGGGIGALTSMGALDMGVEEAELPGLIADWRRSNPNITKFWWDVDAAAIKAVTEKQKTKVGRIIFEYKSGILFITLPSGRKLSYVKPRMAVNRFGRDGLTYEGISENKKWSRIETYGPKLVENIVQGTARDLLAEAMLRVEKKGYPIVMHCHDEIIAEVPEGTGSVEEMCEIMAVQPQWAEGLPLRADGYECSFYQKQ